VWPVVTAVVFMFRSGGVAFQEVGVALSGKNGEHEREVRNTAGWLGAFSSLALALVAFTPLETFWLQRASGLSQHLAAFAVWPLRLLLLYPALDYLLSVQRARWIVVHRTGVITVATAIEAGGLVLVLLVTVGAMNLVGAVGGALAMIAGRLAANGYLFLRARTSPAWQAQ
jgi:hypothetical protein